MRSRWFKEELENVFLGGGSFFFMKIISEVNLHAMYFLGQKWLIYFWEQSYINVDRWQT